MANDSSGKLYITDGSFFVHVVDSQTFKLIKQIRVFDERGKLPIQNLNELEVVDDKWIFANPYTSNEIL